MLAFEAAGTPSTPGPWNDDFANIPGVYLQAQGEFLVGFLESRLVATGALRRVSSDTAEVKRMRVHPDHWRQGYGQAVFNRLQARAVELGYRKLILDPLAQQTAARQFYLKNGFRKFECKQIGPFDCLLFEKVLCDAIRKAAGT